MGPRPTVGIVGYQMGNVGSLLNAFVHLGIPAFIAESPAALADATHLALPGVGAFPRGMEHLERLGFADAVRRLVLTEHRPLLGICLGMQLLATEGHEHRVCKGLGLVPGVVRRLEVPMHVPHVGWNDTWAVTDTPLMARDAGKVPYYYVHSYHLELADPSDRALVCDYGIEMTAGVRRGHVLGVQFHPEKSHADGLALLRRFAEIA